jgi:predicted PurR-regulated permease PerM
MKDGLLKVNQFLLFWILLTVVLVYGRPILIPVTFAIMLAMLMSPVCRKLDSKGLHRVLSTIICIFILLAVFVFVTGVLIAQIISFRDDLPLIAEKTNSIITSLHDYIEVRYDIPVEQQKTVLQNQVKGFSKSSASYLTGFVTGAAGMFVNLAITLVITFLLLYDKEKYETFFLRLIKGNNDEDKKALLNKITLVAQKYLTGRTLSMLVLFVLYLIALLSIGVKNWLLLAAISALVNIIPYVGPFLASVFPIVVALVNFDSYEPAIWVAITFAIIQAIDNYFVTPYVMGGEVSLSALSTIVIIICGGFIWGIAGMILFIPMLSIAKIVFDHVEKLQPYGYLIADPAGESPTIKFKRWVRKKFGKSSNR